MKTRAAALVVAFLFAHACGDEDTVTESNANQKAAEAWCAKIFRCKDESAAYGAQAEPYEDEAACREGKRAELDAPTGNKDEGAPCERDRRLDSADATRCLSDLRSAPCDEAGFPESCESVCRPAS